MPLVWQVSTWTRLQELSDFTRGKLTRRRVASSLSTTMAADVFLNHLTSCNPTLPISFL